MLILKVYEIIFIIRDREDLLTWEEDESEQKINTDVF